MKWTNIKQLILVVSAVLLLAACATTSQSQQAEQAATERNQSNLNVAQPIPNYEWSAQRDVLIQTYNILNESHNTWSVFMSDLGTPIDSCPSIGFPIPAGTQLTNPEKIDRSSGGTVVTLPQAEPHGLYTDPNTNATWVLCALPDGTVSLVYSEPKVITYLWPTEVRDGKIIHPPGKASATIGVSTRTAIPVATPAPKP